MSGPIRAEDRKGSLEQHRQKWDQLRELQLKPTRKKSAIRSQKKPSVQAIITFYSINWNSMGPGDWSWTVIIALGSWMLLVVSLRGQY